MCVCPELLPYSQKITPPTIQYPITYWSYFQFYHCLSFYLYFTDQPKQIIAALTGTIMRQPCSRGKTGWSETVKEERSEPLRESETTSTGVIRRHSATQPLVLHNTLREIPSNFYFLKTKKQVVNFVSFVEFEWMDFLPRSQLGHFLQSSRSQTLAAHFPHFRPCTEVLYWMW